MCGNPLKTGEGLGVFKIAFTPTLFERSKNKPWYHTGEGGEETFNWKNLQSSPQTLNCNVSTARTFNWPI